MNPLSDLSFPASGTFDATLVVALVWGLFGGFSHCIGMCGLFVLSAGRMDAVGPARRLLRHAAFHASRLIVLGALGAAGGAIGSLVGLAARVGRFQGGFTVACGALLALLALGYVGILPRFRVPEPDVMGAGGGIGRRWFGAAMRSREWHQPAALGALVGFLPCGLTYTILLAAAATQSAARGALTLLTFGLGTIPGLLALGMAGHLFRRVFQRPRLRDAMTRAGAFVMLAMGIVLIWRGWPNLF